MSYQETLDYIYSKLPMYSRIGQAAYKADLGNTEKILEYIGNPHLTEQYVHIAGTNGKGSTTNYLASAFVEAGFKVGIYTSPHLIDFRERIRIGSDMIEEDFVISFIRNLRPLIEEIEPSFFEITVAMAFQYFKYKKVDIAIIEVGLGGRLDSTNVINPLLSVITNVSYDHQNLLGNSLEEIAREKAGIIKPYTPSILGESSSDYNIVFESTAKRNNSILKYVENEVKVSYDGNHVNFIMNNNDISIPKNYVPVKYQEKNIRTSYLAWIELGKIYSRMSNIDLDCTFQKGVLNRTANTGFLGRWTHISSKNIDWILESAHNEAGIKAFSETLHQQGESNPTVVFGCVQDKDIQAILNLLPKFGNYHLTQANIPRSMDVFQLNNLFIQHGFQVSRCDQSISSSIEYLYQNRINIKAPVYVIGSVFVVGEVLKILRN